MSNSSTKGKLPSPIKEVTSEKRSEGRAKFMHFEKGKGILTRGEVLKPKGPRKSNRGKRKGRRVKLDKEKKERPVRTGKGNSNPCQRSKKGRGHYITKGARP